jgi:outer membrane receptor protein involved in Fe transport
VAAGFLIAGMSVAKAEDAPAPQPERPAAAKTDKAKDEAETYTLAPLMVTGEKTERSIMDTASSVTVFDDEEIKRRPGVTQLTDILDHIPNFTTSETSNLAPAVRGVDGTGPAQGADAFFAGTRPRLNYQVDGRTLSYNESIFTDSMLWDVDRVEVYRGPQSTLQGRNSIAGAIVVKTKDPTYDFEGGGRVAVGSNNQREASGVVSGPVIDDQVAVRLAVDARRRDSNVDFTGYPEWSNPSRYESLSLHGKILIEPKSLPELRALLTINHVAGAAPQTNSVQRPFDDHAPSTPQMPVFGTNANGGIADVSWKFSDVWSVDSILSATDLRVRRWSPPGQGNAEINAREYVAEPRLKFAFDRVNGFVGAHVFRNQQDESIDLFGGGTFNDTTLTTALFGEATVKATNSVDLTLGGRFEREKRDRDGGAGPFVIDFHETYNVFLPKATLAWHPTDELTLGGTVSRGYNGGGAGFTYDPPFVSYTYKPEYVWNYELFQRTELDDSRIVLTSNVFYDVYKDMQLPFDLNPSPAIWSYVVRNADEAVTYGAEVGARAMLIPGLEGFVNFGLLHTEITKYPGSGVEGNKLARAPAFTLDFGGSYAMENGLDLSLNTRFTDAYQSEVDNKPRGKTDPYWITNAQIGYNFEGARIFADVKNLFNATEPVLLAPGATAIDDVANLTDPRTMTVGVDFTF